MALSVHEEELWRKKILAFIHGYFLRDILIALDTEDTIENREEVKAMFKKHFYIDSLGNLTARELKVFIERCAMILSREMGVDVNTMGDPIENTQDTTLQEWFKLLYEYGKKE